MQNNIVWSAKQRYPKYENVPDDELTLWYAKNNPEFLNQDAGFKADYERITRERSPVATQLDSQPEAGVMESVVRRLGAGYAGVGAAGWKGVEYAQRAFGADEAAQSSKETSQFAEQFAEEQRAKSGKTGIAKYAGAVAEMVPGVLSTVAALPLGPAALITAGGVYGGLSTLAPAEKGFYKQNIEAGMSEEEALSNARLKATGVGVASGVMTGLITRGFNRMGMGGLEATLARTQASAATAKAAAGGVLSAADDAAIALSRQAALAEAKAVVAQSMPRAFIQGAKNEALEEVTDQIGQAALEKMTFNPELTLEQAIESVKMAAIGGGVLGGGFSVMFQPTRVSQSKALIDAENLRASQEQRATEVAQDASTPFDAMSPKGQFDAGAPPVISRAAALAEADNNKNTELLATADANLVTANETAAAANAQVKIANDALAAAVALRTKIVPQTPAQAIVATEAKFEAAMLPTASATTNLESIAVKVADPKAGRLTAEESAILDRLTVEQKKAYLARVKELRNKPSEQAKTGELSQSIPPTPTTETGAKGKQADPLAAANLVTQEWDRANRSDRSFAWFDGAFVDQSARLAFDEALVAGGERIAAHGMSKESTLSGGLANLLKLLKDGLDPIRRGGVLDTAPLVNNPGEGMVGNTTGGHAYRDGPFILVQRPGTDLLTGKLENVAAVLVNQAHANLTPQIADAIHTIRPDIIVESFSEAGKITKQLLAPTPTPPTTAAATPAMQSVEDTKKTKEEKKAISELNKKINALNAQVRAANSAAGKANGRAANAANEASKARARWSKASPAPAAAPVVTATPPVPPSPPAPPAPTPPTPTPPVPPTGTNVFDAENLKDSPVTTFDKIKAALVARFAPLDALQSKLAEKISGYKIKFRLARMYEAVAGSRGKAEARFTELSEQINPLILGVEKQFSELVFFFAAGTRIANGIDTFNNGRKMTKSDVDSNIDKLRTDLIQSGNWAGVRQSLQIYKQSMDSMLDVMLKSQLITKAEYDKLKVPNAFYAPFIKTEVGQRGSRGGTADGQGGYSPLASAKGQQDPDAKLRPALDAALEYYTKVHSRADINAANLYLYELAKQANAPELARVDDTALIREDAISVLVEGKLKQIVVHKDVAAAVAAIPRSVNALSNITTAMAALVRFGATTASIPFQFRNFFFSDMPNAAIVSEAGVRNPVDAINYIFAVWKAFKLAYAGNMGSGATPAGYLAAQKAGVLGGGLQASFEAVGGGRSGRKGDILNTIGDIGRVIEETTKLAVFQRLLDKAGVKNISQMTTEDAMNLIAEVRNYGGSPDFLRGGSLVKSANLTTLLIFVPATIQGNASTIGRMLDNVKSGATKHERDTARAALTRAGLFVGTATLAAYALNHLTKDYEDDFEKISASERRDYWMIPTDTFITSATGEKVRKYYRIQKRGITKMMASSIEDAMAYAKVTDQKHFNEMLAGASESILPFSVKGDTAEKKMMSAAASLNPLLKVFAEYMTGKDFYAGKQTVPRFMELAPVDRQFGERTNENIKVMAGYLGMSPLKLRLALSGLTGGLSGKVLPDKPIEGDENGAANILGLVRSGYKEDADKELIEEARQSAAGRSVDRRREAVKFVDQREGAKLSDIYQEAAKKYGKTQPDLVQKIEEILTGKSRGVTREDEVLIQLPPEERSGIIMTRLSRIPKDQQLDYVKGLYRKGVVTDATLVQLRRRGMPF